MFQAMLGGLICTVATVVMWHVRWIYLLTVMLWAMYLMLFLVALGQGRGLSFLDILFKPESGQYVFPVLVTIFLIGAACVYEPLQKIIAIAYSGGTLKDVSKRQWQTVGWGWVLILGSGVWPLYTMGLSITENFLITGVFLISPLLAFIVNLLIVGWLYFFKNSQKT